MVLKTPVTLTAKSFLVAATMSVAVPVVSSDTPALAITRSMGVASERHARGLSGRRARRVSWVFLTRVTNDVRTVDAHNELLHPFLVCNVDVPQLDGGAPIRREASEAVQQSRSDLKSEGGDDAVVSGSSVRRTLPRRSSRLTRAGPYSAL